MKKPILLTTVLMLVAVSSFAAGTRLGTTNTYYSITGSNNRTLTISGTGDMPNFESEHELPWKCQSMACSWEITTVIIEDGVTSIGSHILETTSAQSLTIPPSVTKIASYAFTNSGIRSITIPSTVTTIEKYAFSAAFCLTSVTILPSPLTTIEEFVFYNCPSLTSVNLPEGITTIKNYAFTTCSSLASITIPASVTQIETKAFAPFNGEFSTIISLNPVPPYFLLHEGGLNLSNRTLKVPPGSLAAYQNSCLDILDNCLLWAFCPNIEELSEIPETVVTPSNNGAEVTWSSVPEAVGFVLRFYVRESSNLFLEVRFDEKGKWITTEYVLLRSDDAGFNYTVDNLSSGTEYSYTLTALDADNNVLALSLGSFTTSGGTGTGINDTEAAPAQVVGYYTTTGAKLSKEPKSGVYVVQYDNGTTEKKMKGGH
jgi:hypothetical protein